MQHGKDYLSDKPGITSLDQLAEVRRVQQQTKRIYSIFLRRAARKQSELQGG